MMNFKQYLVSALCALTLVAGFASCSNDDDDTSWKEGSKVDMPQYRAFVLTEGSYGGNNSHLFFVDPSADTTSVSDIYETQNGKKVGDTANDMIADDGDIYIVVNVSKYIARLNGSGVEQVRYADFSKLGEPRDVVADDGKLYVTCYGGYVARFDAKTLAFEDSVKVNANPEQIIVYNGKIYCVNSGYGKGHTMSIIDEDKFDKAESVETLTNPYGIQEANGHIYVSAYGSDYSNPVAIYNATTKTFKQIGNAGRVLAYGDNLYMANSTSSDWVNYTTTLSVYSATSGSTSAWTLTNAPSAIGKSVVYMIERNPYDGSIYIGTTDYYSNGKVYHFDSTGKYKTMFSAGGINPNSMVFLK